MQLVPAQDTVLQEQLIGRLENRCFSRMHKFNSLQLQLRGDSLSPQTLFNINFSREVPCTGCIRTDRVSAITALQKRALLGELVTQIRKRMETAINYHSMIPQNRQPAILVGYIPFKSEVPIRTYTPGENIFDGAADDVSMPMLNTFVIHFPEDLESREQEYFGSLTFDECFNRPVTSTANYFKAYLQTIYDPITMLIISKPRTYINLLIIADHILSTLGH